VLSLRTFLEGKRLSELQEIHSFWVAGGEKPPQRREAAVDALAGMLRDEGLVGTRLKLLAEKPLLVLQLLVRSDGFASDLPGLVGAADGLALEGYEVEAAARALGRRGFLEVLRERSWARYGRESYAVPCELAEVVGSVLMEDRRGPRQVFTLAGHLAALPSSRVRRLLRTRGLPEEAAGRPPGEVAGLLLGDRRGPAALEPAAGEHVRALLVKGILECGGVVPRARYRRDMGAPLRWRRKRWQRTLEEAGLGTVTTLDLSDCGLDLEGETTVLFAEVVERALAGMAPRPEEVQRVASSRVDLLTDVSYLVRRVASHPLRVTHGRTIHRAAYARVLDGLTFREDALVDRTEVFQVVYELGFGLGLFTVTEDRLLVLARPGEAWDAVPMLEKVRRIYDRFLEERGPEHRDFHEKRLRRLLVDRLAGLAPGAWARLRALAFLARNEYLASLEEEGVRAAYRNRFQHSFDPPREDPGDLAEALVDWTIGRLHLLGLVEVGFLGEDPAAVRVSELGARILGGEGGPGAGGRNGRLAAGAVGPPPPPAREPKPLVVNPDFEVLLLPEGDVNEVAHTLDRFAVRVRSDEVVRYRIERDAVERAVARGMTTDEMVGFLAGKSRAPLPQNVVYSVREWGGRVRFGRQREAVLLEVDQEDALDRALALEPLRALLLARLGPKVAALRSPVTDWKTIEALRALGVYLRE